MRLHRDQGPTARVRHRRVRRPRDRRGPGRPHRRRANANKQLIYAYFGSKDQLFDAVLTTRFPALTEDVPFAPDDLAGYVGRLFDHLVEHPEVLRLATWAGLERPTAVAAFEALAPTTRPTPGRRSG